MKLYKLFMFAAMTFAGLTAMTQTGAAQKTKQNRNWVEFTGHQTVSFGQNMTPASYTCESSIYATANFAAPVDLADGFYVTIAANGKLLMQEKMTVDGNPGARRSIPVDIVPDDDAELGFPAASLDYSHALLTELAPGKHNITVAVSVGEGKNEVIAAGAFSFDNRRGCAERFERVAALINGSGTAEVEAGEETEVEPTEDDTDAPPVRPHTQQPTKPPGNDRNHIEFVNNCSDDQMVTYEQPDGTFSVLSISPGFSRSNDFPVGTQFYRGNGRHGSPFFRLGASQYVNEMDKARSAEKIQLCQ